MIRLKDDSSRLLAVPKNCVTILLISCLQITVTTGRSGTIGINNNGNLFGISNNNRRYMNHNIDKQIIISHHQGTNFNNLFSIRGGSTEATTNDATVDFGTVLSKSYRVESTRVRKKNYLPILGGSFTEALQIARSNGRLLVIFLPSGKPNDKKNVDLDRQAITTFLSSEITKVAEGKARKKSKQNKNNDGTVNNKPQSTTAEVAGVSEQKSFVLWSTTNSVEIAAVLKRINGLQPKNPKTGTKRPILAVVYPAISPSSAPTLSIIPKLITQHHCSPPPTIETAVAWLQSIRKRSANYYNKMQTDRIEAELYKQRIEGYKGSIQSDIQRKQQEELAEKERQQREKQRQVHIKKIQLRRQQLQESLPEEPLSTSGNKNIITIALRFVDDKYVTKQGVTQRRFVADETTLGDIFNWIDVQFEIERELIVLQSMKGGAGAKSYTWNDFENENSKTTKDDDEDVDEDDEDNDDDDDKGTTKTLSELGFGKMTALRVTVETPKDN